MPKAIYMTPSSFSNNCGSSSIVLITRNYAVDEQRFETVNRRSRGTQLRIHCAGKWFYMRMYKICEITRSVAKY